MFPTPHTVIHARRVKTGTNEHGQPIFTYAAPVSRQVYGIQPGETFPDTTPGTANLVVTQLDMLTPDGDWAHGDAVTITGRGDFTVYGGVDDYNTGPFGFRPGFKVTLRSVNG